MKIFKFLIIPLMIVMLLGFGMNASAELHSKWSAGDLIFYDGTTNIWAIRNGTDGVKVYDDLNLTFGTDNDATIMYDETTDNVLEITCSNGIAISGATAFDAGIVITGGTNAINITSTGSAFGLLYDVDMPTQIGANVEGIKVILERTADVVIGTSNIIGAEFIIKQGSDSYAAGMAPQITGVRIAMAGANTKATVYGLKCETQQGGFINYVGMFSVNADCVLHSSGAVLYVRSYVAAAHALVKIEQPAATTAAKGLYITDNAGTGTITDAIYFDCRNSTSVLRFATGTGPISIISDAMTKNPESDVEDGYLTVYVGTNAYQVPIYSD